MKGRLVIDNSDMKIDVQPENTCMHLNYTVIEMFRNEQFFANPLKEHTCLCHILIVTIVNLSLRLLSSIAMLHWTVKT